MFRYNTHQEIDFAKWDACVHDSANGIIYGLSWYLDIVAPGWAGIIQEEHGRYVAVMPVLESTKFALKYIRQPVFAQQLGVFSLQPPTPEEWQQILTLLKQKFRFITRYEFNTGNPAVLPAAPPQLLHKVFHTHHLDLRQDYGAIVSGYKKDRRWRINKAKRNAMTIAKSDDVDRLIALFAANTEDRIYGVVGEEYEYRLLRQIYRAARSKGMVDLVEARNGAGEVLAMIMLLFYKGKIIYIFNASSAEGKQKGAISLLLDHTLHTYAGGPQHTCFDFESPEVAGVAQFYASFGAEAVPFASISLNNLPAPVRWLKTARTAIVRRFLQ